jgi:hypothetical protein
LSVLACVFGGGLGAQPHRDVGGLHRLPNRPEQPVVQAKTNGRRASFAGRKASTARGLDMPIL